MNRLSEIENDGLDELNFDTLEDWADYYSEKNVLARLRKNNKESHSHKKKHNLKQ